MIPAPGIVSIESQLRELPPAIPLPIANFLSFKRASEDYAFFMPYMLPMMLPYSQVEPLLECKRAVDLPTEHRYVAFDNEWFDVGARGRDLGLSGNVLHMLPRQEWGSIANFIKSMVLYSPEDSLSFAIGIQVLHGYGIDIYATVLGTVSHVYGWEQCPGMNVLSPRWRPKVFDKLHAASAQTLVTAFLQGDTNPLITTEKIHGARSTTSELPSEMDNQAALRGEDSSAR